MRYLFTYIEFTLFTTEALLESMVKNVLQQWEKS